MEKGKLKCQTCGNTLNKHTAGQDKEKCNECKVKEWLNRAKLIKNG